MPETAPEDVLAKLSTLMAAQAKTNAEAIDALGKQFSSMLDARDRTHDARFAEMAALVPEWTRDRRGRRY